MKTETKILREIMEEHYPYFKREDYHMDSIIEMTVKDLKVIIKKSI